MSESPTKENVSHETVAPTVQPIPPDRALAKAADRSSLAIRESGAGGMFVARSMQDVIEFGKVMSKAGPAIPPSFRDNAGLCIAVTMQALRWEMDPFAVASKAYVTKDKAGNERLSYEAQLVAAILNTRGPFQNRPTLEFTGRGDMLQCKVSATIRGESKPRHVTTPMVRDIGVKNSPLWKSDPEQQLSYYAQRAFGRRVCPEVLLGVYTVDEVASMESLPVMVIDAADANKPEPARENFRADRGTPKDGLTVVDDEEDDLSPGPAQEAQASPPTAAENQVTEPSQEAQAPADGQESDEDRPSQRDQESADAVQAAIAEAIQRTNEAVARAIDELAQYATIEDAKDYAKQIKIMIDTQEDVPPAERGRLRGVFNSAFLRRCQTIAGERR